MELSESQLDAVLEQSPEESPTTSGWVVFLITDVQLNPDDITAQLGIQPDRVQYPEPTERRAGIWQINSSLPGQQSVTDHFNDILKKLIPIHKRLWRLSERYRLEFFCSIQKTGESTAPIILPSKILLLLGYIGADVELEVSDAYAD